MLIPPQCMFICTYLKIYNKIWTNIYKIRSIVQASKSILGDKLVKVWMCAIFGLQLLAFILEPIARPGTFRLYLDSMWNCNNNCGPSASHVMFVIHTLILRISIPLLLVTVVLSFMPKSSHAAQIMHYRYFYEVLSPVGVIIMAILALFSNYY